jgi:hypothetical protein
MVGASGAGFGKTAVNAKAASSKAARKNNAKASTSEKKKKTADDPDMGQGAAAAVPFSPAPLAETDDGGQMDGAGGGAPEAATTTDDAEEDPAVAGFWALQQVAPYWTVPLAHGASMPWLKPYERGLLLAFERCHAQHKTPLLLDDKADALVDTYYSYQASIVIEAKRLVLDVAMKRKTHEEVMESLRRELVAAMRFGHVLYVRLGDSAADFRTMFNGEDTFPSSAVFDRALVASLLDYREGAAKSLWKAEHPLAKVLREDDLTQGLFQLRFAHKAKSEDGAREGFEVVVCTQHPADAFGEMLREAIPLELMQPIKPQPSTVKLKYSHYNQEFPLEVGGAVSFEALDERYALSFVFKGRFVVRLVEAPPQAPPGGGRQRGWRERGTGANAGGASSANSTSGADAGPADGEDQAVRRPTFMLEPSSGCFRGLRGGATYEVTVEEDEAAEAAASGGGGGRGSRLSAEALAGIQQHAAQITTKPKAKALPGRSDDGTSAAGFLLSEELKSLSVAEIEERSERYRALREAQDLQDVVFSAK